MKIAYISADFDVPIWGSEGASIHLREMAAAFCREGHAVWIVSPEVETMAGGNAREEETARSNQEIFASSAPQRPDAAVAGDLDDVMFVPVLPHKHHVQIFKELETLDKFWGMKTRHTQELRRLLFNLTLYEKALNYLRSCRVDFIYERYSLFSHAGIRLAKALGVPHLLIVGDGPEREKLERQAEATGLRSDMTFTLPSKLHLIVLPFFMKHLKIPTD
jgi:hypothetical protein